VYPIDGRPVPKTILVTSAVPREGKTFVTANLGVSLAQGLDQHALLVDCDLRRPALGRMFGMSDGLGLAEYLRDNVGLENTISRTAVERLSILRSGKPPVNPAELLVSSRMSALVEELSSRYEDRLIIFDSPPFQMAAESIVLAGKGDAVIRVVRQGGAGKPQIQKLVERLGAERILGVVFNAYSSNIIERSLMQGYGHYQSSYEEYS
jgi:capsular exopolysaccharide synthesis family protein